MFFPAGFFFFIVQNSPSYCGFKFCYSIIYISVLIKFTETECNNLPCFMIHSELIFWCIKGTSTSISDIFWQPNGITFCVVARYFLDNTQGFPMFYTSPYWQNLLVDEVFPGSHPRLFSLKDCYEVCKLFYFAGSAYTAENLSLKILCSSKLTHILK